MEYDYSVIVTVNITIPAIIRILLGGLCAVIVCIVGYNILVRKKINVNTEEQ